MLERTGPSAQALRIHDLRLHADPGRVVLRPFHLGWQSKNAPGGRAQKLVDDILSLSDEQAEVEYERVRKDFAERHWQTEQLFQQRFAEVRENLARDVGDLSPTRQRLIGAFFCHEYTYAAAALMNPSIIPHPDQSGMSLPLRDEPARGWRRPHQFDRISRRHRQARRQL